MDFEPIPEFLRRTKGETTSAPMPRPRKPEPWCAPKPPRGWPKDMPVPKTVTPEAIALARSIAKQKKEAAAERFALLKERRR